MSKKKHLKFKKYYSGENPGFFSDIVSIRPQIDRKEFSQVTKYLTGRGYIHLSDAGDCHLLPKGVFFHEAVANRAQQLMNRDGASRYRFSSFFKASQDRAVSSLVEKFTSQIFTVSGGKISKAMHLKYASDPIVFDYFSGKSVHTPLKIYSPDYFFRAIQSGEVKPLVNPREFFMTDFHYFCDPGDFDAFISAALLNKDAMRLFVAPNEWYLNIDTNEEFWGTNRARLLELLDALAVNAVVNVTSEKTHYYTLQLQYVVDYYRGNCMQLANLQFDEQSGTLFRITSKQSGQYVSIIHGTLFGRIEKVMATVFGKALERAEVEQTKPLLPPWLNPILVRIIPAALDVTALEKVIGSFSQELLRLHCRFDVDVRDLSLSQKVRDAEQDWIPFQVMIGDKELRNNVLSLRDRTNDTVSVMSEAEIVACIAAWMGDAPHQNQTTPEVLQF